MIPSRQLPVILRMRPTFYASTNSRYVEHAAGFLRVYFSRFAASSDLPDLKVTDIADAMILRQLFERLLNYGVVCVITSK